MPFRQRHPRTVREMYGPNPRDESRWDRFNEWLEGPGYRGLLIVLAAGCFAMASSWWWGR